MKFFNSLLIQKNLFQHHSDPLKLGRFEMLIIMPEHHLGLQFFQFNAKKAVDDVDTLGNLIGKQTFSSRFHN